MDTKHSDVLIIGGGISGCSLLYLLTAYTDVGSVTLLEKYDHLDPLNSNAHSNSQTLHCGDIETNYSHEKAAHVNVAASMTLSYVDKVSDDLTLKRNYGKMLLGVGEEECRVVRTRAEEFTDLFPTIRIAEAEELATLEPSVALQDGKPRPEEIVALYNDQGWAIDYGRLTDSFAAKAQEMPGKDVTIDLSTEIVDLNQVGDRWSATAKSGQVYEASFLVVSAGSYSLLLAKKAGYGKNLSVLPVSGSFYFAPKVLEHKVYTVQNPKLPFAAIHGDPDMTEPDKTRFGPTALVLPVLERFNAKTAKGFMESFNFDHETAGVLYELMKDKDIRHFIYENLGYEIPVYGKRSFIHAVNKIVPDLTVNDIEFADHTTGVRPQMIDRDAKQLMMGAAKIDPGNCVIFNMTPSPGATSALHNASEDLRSIADQLELTVNDTALAEIYGGEAVGVS